MTTTLLTGLPRSGTTLTFALLNELPDTLAVAEPLQLFRHGDREWALREIDKFIAESRQQALTRGKVISKHVDGVIPDNWVEPPNAGKGLRKVLEVRGLIQVRKALTPGFHLIIKHPAEFSAMADILASRYRLVALVRHPLAVLAAWQTVNMPVQRGHMPMAEAFNPGLAMILAAETDRVKRQVSLIGWLLGVYADFLPKRILRYEDLVANPRQHLTLFTPHVHGLERSISAYDPVIRYPGVDLAYLAEELLAIRTTVERFYPDFVKSLEPWLSCRSSAI